ncbi:MULTISPECIES: type III secretion system translocon subunit SctE [Burkholderia]|uniref:Secretion protein n=1 Tax=Burkholderia mayonis TaxID=1385591 RepID=A0A1B4FM76_9BURK|nr:MULTISPECIES: type III secretion system translocon subunit SctE [Burkholderia]AOJ04762.1 secretion protein [Burkholderia mayonis]KVE36813.1 secretion protein [Burkholderia sp. BDU5]KVE41299.1 secretion protein [Burkholderia mayonis]
MAVAINAHGTQGSALAPIEPEGQNDGVARARVAAGLLRGASVVVDEARARLAADARAPFAAQALVSMKDAAGALGRVLDKFDRASGDKGAASSIGLRAFESVSMETMLLATTLLSTKVLGNTAELKSKALEIMSAKQDEVRQQEIKDYREQIDKAVEQQQKAKKAGIFGVIFDWIVAAVEVVSGVAKMIGGALSGNAMMVAGGAMDLMAGFAGVVKATMNTLALIDEKNADKYRQAADVAAKVQLTFEIAGAVVDVTSAARNMLLTKAIPKATTAVLEKGAGEALEQAIKSGSKQAVEKTAQAIGKEVASQVSEQILQGLGKTALEASKQAGKEALQKTVQQLGVNRMLESFSREAIEKMVTKAVQKVANEAIDRGVELTAQALTKAIAKQVKRDVMAAALKASLSPLLNTARATIGAASQTTSGVLGIERAKLQKEIDQLILDQQWLQMCFAFYKQQKEAQTKDAKELVEKAGQAVEDGSQALRQSAAVQAQIAASMV